jgi:hypothetical protein
MANVTELERVWDWIQAHPESHDPRAWAHSTNRKNQAPDPYPIRGSQPVCGTSLCFAGATVALNGYGLGWHRGDLLGALTRGAGWRAYDAFEDLPQAGRFRRSYEIDELAVDILELDSYDACDLFDASNTLADIRRIINEIEARETQS